MLEHFFICPYCFSQISMLLDTSVKQQSYVEDCEVCCNPIELTFAVENYEDEITVTSFDAASLGQ
ncbi:MAG: CPXCG motif-containing cysteine-rich protein [Tunicatimonas sp.]|uniref:CPXCG motif-containing cysteine-rich protein n=1 Tax=Tunicatimonas sp. TaxID=1940096 RepID=UPI003C75054B